MRRLLPFAIVLAIAIASEACARRSPGPTVSLVELVRSYDREVTPYHPLTASDVGLRQYDRVFANDIGADYRSGWIEAPPLAAYCNPYRVGWEAFLRHVAADAPLESDFAAGIRDVAFADACHRSMRERTWIALPPAEQIR